MGRMDVSAEEVNCIGVDLAAESWAEIRVRFGLPSERAMNGISTHGACARLGLFAEVKASQHIVVTSRIQRGFIATIRLSVVFVLVELQKVGL